MTRGVSTISLNHHGSKTLAGGVYCCTIPRASGVQTLCVEVQGELITAGCACAFVYFTGLSTV